MAARIRAAARGRAQARIERERRPRGECCKLGADDFLFRDREGRLGVIAGFPWFGEWGRDTFVSLPGLTLARGRVEECGEALEGALRFLTDGRLPNIVGPDRKTSVYGSLDTPLWFAWAVEAYDEAGGDPRRVEDVLLPAVEEIARALLDGKRPGAICDDARAWSRSRPGAESLTWMDARVDGRPVTPRRGAAVEVNALWYSLLRFLERKHRSAGRERDARQLGRAAPARRRGVPRRASGSPTRAASPTCGTTAWPIRRCGPTW